MSETSEANDAVSAGGRDDMDLLDVKGTKVPDTPPVIRLPCCPVPYNNIELKTLSPDAVEVISGVDRCKQVVAKLQREKVVAMAAEGVNIGREGPLTLIQIGTCAGHVYVFDILICRELVGKGRLKYVLEDENIIKVLHDCSSVSAALTFQFAVSLRNVFDTQIAHLVIEEHQGRRLPSGLKVSDICLQYSDNSEQFYTYDWRTNSKVIWMATMGNFWANRPLTQDMLEFAAGDVIVLIPDVYRHQSEYIDGNGLRVEFEGRVEEWLQIEIDDIVKENYGKRAAETVVEILTEMDGKYGEKATLFNILDPDDMNALSVATYEDAEGVSERIRKFKTEQILGDIDGIELKMRTDSESWEGRNNVLDHLRYYMKLPDCDVREKAKDVMKEMLRAILEHIEDKYLSETTTNMMSLTERDALLTISHVDIAQNNWGNVVTSLYWKLMQEEVHGMINFLRFYPSQFSLTETEYSKVVYFAKNTDIIPEEVSSLSAGLLHAIRAYSAASGGYVIDVRRRTGVF